MAKEVRKRRRGTTRISSKHQVTIPTDALHAAGLQPGDVLEVAAAEPGQVALRRAKNPYRHFAGSLTGVYPAGYLDKLPGRLALIVLDTSVLVALLDADDALHEQAADALAQAWDAGEELLVPSLAYAETLVRPLEHGGEPLARADAFFASQTIVPIDRTEAREAARLRGLHRPWLRMPDALVLATGVLREATILTGDARWAKVSPLATIIS